MDELTCVDSVVWRGGVSYYAVDRDGFAFLTDGHDLVHLSSGTVRHSCALSLAANMYCQRNHRALDEGASARDVEVDGGHMALP